MATEEERLECITAIEGIESVVAAAMAEEFARDPFWEARYGERGRKFIRQDSDANLKQLLTAIATDNPASLTVYYRWLRGLLVFRGMCTRHLYETLDLIGRELSTRLPGFWELIAPYHAGGYAGLAYEQPASRALADAGDRIIAAVTERQFSPLRMVEMRDSQQARAASQRATGTLLSYLADAVEVGNENLFSQYLAFLVKVEPPVGIEPAALRDLLRLLSDEIYFALPDETRQPILSVLGHGMERVQV
jgi:hypothetical protein